MIFSSRFMKTINKIITVILCVILVVTTIPADALALRPLAYKVSVIAGRHHGSEDKTDIHEYQESVSSDDKKLERREFFEMAAVAAGIISLLGFFGYLFYRIGKFHQKIMETRERERQKRLEIMNKGSEKIPQYAPEKHKVPLAQRIANLDASELAKRAVFLFGKDNRYKQVLFRKDEPFEPEPAENDLYYFITFFTKSELRGVVEEGLGKELYDTDLEDKSVRAAANKKLREVLRSQVARSIHTKMALAENKEERLAIFLGMLENFSYAYRYADLSREDFKRLLKINGLIQLIEDFPELLSLPDLLDIRLDSWLSREERLQKIHEKASSLNKTFFIPHGFYASPFLFEGFRRLEWDHWFLRIRHTFEFEGKRAYVVQRLRDDGERLTAVGFSDSKHPDYPAIVFHEDKVDKEKIILDATQGRKRYKRFVSEDKQIQREFEKQITLMLIKAEEERPELKNPGVIRAYGEFSTVLHELSHIIRDTTDEELIPYLVELAYGEPHTEAETMLWWMMGGNDWIYSEIFAPMTKMQKQLPLYSGDIMNMKLFSIAKFRSMGREEIQHRAKELLRIESPGVYEALESQQGKRFREETLKALKARNMITSDSAKVSGYDVQPAEIPATLQTSNTDILKIGRIGVLGLALLEEINNETPVSRREFLSLGISKTETVPAAPLGLIKPSTQNAFESAA